MDHDDELDPASARVREELARLGADDASAPAVPGAVTARIGAALRTASPAHSVRRPRFGRWQLLGLLVGVAAALAGSIIGVVMLSADDPPPGTDTGPTARSITVTQHVVPLPDAEILALLDRTPDYGPLTDASQRASCLDRLGYSGVTPLGARPVDIAGGSGVLLLVPGHPDDTLVALVAPPDCAGLLAHTVLRRP
ncbi:hypothetical protein ABQE93_04350 [Mycolicibacterium sp. XJ662]